MPTIHPLTASGSRDLKRPRPIPKQVREAIKLMIYGRADDEECKPLGFIEAAKACQIAPDHMRRYLDRADVRALLRAERRVYRDAISAGNEAALKRVRDHSKNGMCVVASVRQLEEMGSDQAVAARGQIPQSPGFIIVIAQSRPIEPQAAPMPGFTIEASATAVPSSSADR